MAIHGATSENLNPLVDGVLDSLTSKISSKDVSRAILSSKQSVSNEVEKNVLSSWKREYYQGNENLLKSMNVYYGQDIMDKAKYRATRKANKSYSVLNFAPYSTLSKYIREIDICNIQDNEDEEQIDGICRPLSEYALRLAKFKLM